MDYIYPVRHVGYISDSGTMDTRIMKMLLIYLFVVIALFVLVLLLGGFDDTDQLHYTWDSNTEPDMSYYVLFVKKDSETIEPGLIIYYPETDAYIEWRGPGEYEAWLVAVDTSGNVSEESDHAVNNLLRPPGTGGGCQSIGPVN